MKWNEIKVNSDFYIKESILTIMLRLLLPKAQGKPSKPCHVGIHWIVLTEHSQMITHVPGFQTFFRFFA